MGARGSRKVRGRMLAQLIPTLLILGFLIFVHELGHFLVCKWSGVVVEKFSIGFGPEIIRWRRRGTDYAISIIPLGGFVKPRGESFSEVQGGSLSKGDFLAASRLQRLGILVAGVAMNYLFAFLLLIPVFHFGFPVLKSKIGGFVNGYPAESSGLRTGDAVVAVNGQPVSNWQEMTLAIFDNQKPNLALQVRRNDQVLNIVIAPKTDSASDALGEKRQISRIGITPSNEYDVVSYPFLASIQKAFVSTVSTAALTYKAIWRLVTGRLSVKTLSGPIGIMAMAGAASKMGLIPLLQLTSMISISLAVVNLLPIPALDGGHILFLLNGWIRRKELSHQIQERVTQVGFACLMVLMVFVIYNDLINIGAFTKIKSFFGG